MNACDVCGDPLAPEAAIYEADEFRELLAQGFEPDPRVVGLLGILAGMSAAQARAHWFRHVGARPAAEWRLCPACARQAERVRRGPPGRRPARLLTVGA